jgi:hypothetical protein
MPAYFTASRLFANVCVAMTTSTDARGRTGRPERSVNFADLDTALNWLIFSSLFEPEGAFSAGFRQSWAYCGLEPFL